MGDPSPAEIARRLRETAQLMERAVASGDTAQVERRICARYGPFVAELADRATFCRDLASTPITPDSPPEEAGQAILQVASRHRLPTREPYDLYVWAEILLGARVLSDPELPMRVSGPHSVAIQFEYVGTTLQRFRARDHLPLIDAARFDEPRDVSRAELRQLVADFCLHPLMRFRQRAVRGKLYPFKAVVHVRVLIFELQLPVRTEPSTGHRNSAKFTRPDPLYKDRVVTNFTIAWRPRRRARTVSDEIAARALPLLQEEVQMVAGAGRLPDPRRHARWWARAVFDGMSHEEIASSERDDVDAIDLIPTIEIALRRLGQGVPTE